MEQVVDCRLAFVGFDPIPELTGQCKISAVEHWSGQERPDVQRCLALLQLVLERGPGAPAAPILIAVEGTHDDQQCGGGSTDANPQTHELTPRRPPPCSQGRRLKPAGDNGTKILAQPARRPERNKETVPRLQAESDPHHNRQEFSIGQSIQPQPVRAVAEEGEKEDRRNKNQGERNQRCESGKLHAQSQPAPQPTERHPDQDEQDKGEQSDPQDENEVPLNVCPSERPIKECMPQDNSGG